MTEQAEDRIRILEKIGFDFPAPFTNYRFRVSGEFWIAPELAEHDGVFRAVHEYLIRTRNALERQINSAIDDLTRLENEFIEVSK